MSDALRELLASFVVEVDKAGELAKGNAAIDALKARLGDLQAELDKVRVPAERAGKAIRQAMESGFGATSGLAAAMEQSRQSATSGIFGQFGAAQGAHEYSSPIGPQPLGPQFGPTRETLNAGRAAMAESEAAAAKYAQTLRGKLATAVQAVKDGFNSGGGGGGGGGGPGLIERLGDFRTQVQLLGAAAAVAGIKRLVEGIGDIGEAAQRLGVTTDQFQRLDVLAKQNGTSVEALGTAFRTLANVAVEPTKQSTEAFTKLGISVKDSHGQFKSTNDLFFEVSGALAGVANETTRSALAQDLLGRSAIELKPLFAAGTAEIEKQRKALAAMHVISHETIVQADELADSWKTLGPSMLAATEPLIKILIPALKKLTEWVQASIEGIAKFLKQTDFTSVALAALAGVTWFKVIPALAEMLPILKALVELGGGWTKVLGKMAGAGVKATLAFLAWAIPAAVIEDFIGFIRGNQSAIGEALDYLFGKGASTAVIDALGKSWDLLATSVKTVLELMHLYHPNLADLDQRDRATDTFQKSNAANFLSTLGSVSMPGQFGQVYGSSIPMPDYSAPKASPYGMTEGAPNSSREVASIGPTSITINMGQSATAQDVSSSVASVVDDRNRLVSQRQPL